MGNIASTTGHIVYTVLMNNGLNALAAFRWWYLRKRARTTTASRISEIFFHCGVLSLFINTAVVYYRLALVKQVKDNPNLTYIEKQYALLSPKILKAGFVELSIYPLNVYLVKAAFVGMYYDFSVHLRPHLRMSLHVLAGFVGVCYLISQFMIVFWCQPIKSNWEGTINSCNSLQAFPVVNTATWLSVACDLAIAIYATVIIRSLHMKRRDIWALIVVYAVGSLSIVATVVRYAVVYKWIHDVNTNSPDASNVVEFWTSMEVVAGAISFVLPAFRAALRSKSDRTTTEYTDGSRSHKKSQKTDTELFSTSGDPKDQQEHEPHVHTRHSFEVTSSRLASRTASFDSAARLHPRGVGGV